MILLRSLTILLSFCFALLSWPANKVQAADCPKPSKDKPLEERVSILVEKARHLSGEKKFKRAEKCLEKAIGLDSKRRDLAYFKARLKAWQNFHDEADLIVAAFTDDDTDSLELRADLARYRADYEAAQALHYRAALGALYGVETQDQSIRSMDFDAGLVQYRKSLSLGLSSLVRDFGAVTLEDKVYRLGAGFGFAPSEATWYRAQEVTVTLGGAPDAQFSPKQFLALRHTLVLSEAWTFYGEVGSKSYPDLYVRTLQLGAAVVDQGVRYSTRAFFTRGKKDDFAGYGSVAYDDFFLSPEIYVIGGRDAASRPYISRTDSAAFLTIGVQLAWALNENFKLRASTEDRQEKGYRLKAASLALLWAD